MKNGRRLLCSVFLFIVSAFILYGCGKATSESQTPVPPTAGPETTATSSHSATTAPEPVVNRNTPILITVRDYASVKPIIDANGGFETQPDSLYAKRGMSIKIVEDKNSSVSELFKNGTDIMALSVSDYAISYEALHKANINSKMYYIVSASNGNNVVLKREDSIKFKTGMSKIGAADNSDALFAFLIKNLRGSVLNNEKDVFIKSLPSVIKNNNDVDNAYDTLQKGEVDFLCIDREQYTTLAADRGITDVTEEPAVLYYGLVKNEDSSKKFSFVDIITDAIVAMDLPGGYVDESVRYYSYECAHKYASLDVLYNNNIAEDIFLRTLEINDAINGIKSAKPDTKKIFAPEMLSAAPDPESAPDPTVKMPALIGKPMVTASELLETNNLELGEITWEFSSIYAAEIVIAQGIDADTDVELGGTVDITVSKGSEPQVTEAPVVKVPDLLGMSVDEAKRVLKDTGLQLGDVSADFSKDEDENKVISQYPAADDDITTGSAVSIVIGDKRAVFPMDVMFTIGGFEAKNIIGDFHDRIPGIVDYAKNYPGKTIQITGYVSSRYTDKKDQNNPENLRRCLRRANAIRDLLKPHLPNNEIIIEAGGGLYAGKEHNPDYFKAQISFYENR